MKKYLWAFILLSFTLQAAWDQPQVLCPEEVLPKGLKCLDLGRVADPLLDYPAELTLEERNKWFTTWASDLKLCRHQEVLRRELARPGSFRPLQIQIAWMITNGGEKPQEKLSALMSAATKYQIPPQVLIGAITQESLLSSLGISPDGGNFSCGIAQLNLTEWCQGLLSLPAAERARINWPQISCGNLSSTMLTPFYDIAKKKLGSRPEYRIDASDFAGITFEQVKSHLPPANEELQLLRFKAINSFIQNCQDFNLSISAKALTLKNLFQHFVPPEMKNSEVYLPGTTFGRSCQSPYSSKYYPLHSGWLLAVAIYNAGPRQTKMLEHYYQSREKLPPMTPVDLIEALHWGGKFQEGSNRVYFAGRDGKPNSQSWYKSCVVQRHISRVVQHVSLPGRPLARSLEQVPCSPDEVPAYRQSSPGIKLL